MGNETSAAAYEEQQRRTSPRRLATRHTAPAARKPSNVVVVVDANNNVSGGGGESDESRRRSDDVNNNIPRSASMTEIHRTESSAERGRQLLETFDRARTGYAKAYAGDDEQQTVTFCKDVLERGCPDLAAKYRVVATISCGTTSVVCRALNLTSPGAPDVAIKYARLSLPHPSGGGGGSVRTANEKAVYEERKRQFEIEAKLQRRCAGPHVVELYDCRILENFAIFVMEYLPRTLLEATVENNRLGAFHELQAARAIRSLAMALASCHFLGIAHLDVKLDNCLVDARGEVKLCDFGLADLVPVHRTAATPLYAPPEILTEGRCDEKADMWSLGVVAFILLCGYPPFQPDVERCDLRECITGAMYSFRISEGWGEISSLARDLVSKLLVVDPTRRWSAERLLKHPWLVAAGEITKLPSVPLPSASGTVGVDLASNSSTKTGNLLPQNLNVPLSSSSSKSKDGIGSEGELSSTSVSTAASPVVLLPGAATQEPMETSSTGWSRHQTRPPPLKRHESVLNLEMLARAEMSEAEKRRRRTLREFLQFAEEIRLGWRTSGLQGVVEVGRRDPTVGNLVSFAEDVTRGYREGGVHGIADVLKKVSVSGRGSSGGMTASSSSSPPTATNGTAILEMNDDDAEFDPNRKVQYVYTAKGSPFPTPSTTTQQHHRQEEEEEEDQAARESASRNDASTSSSTTTTTTGRLPGATESTAGASADVPPVSSSFPVTPSRKDADDFDDRRFLLALYGSSSPLAPPQWVPDSEAVCCRLCESPFTFFWRRHHCRACGQVVCGDCSRTRRVVARVHPSKKQRVCDLCAVSSRPKSLEGDRLGGGGTMMMTTTTV